MTQVALYRNARCLPMLCRQVAPHGLQGIQMPELSLAWAGRLARDPSFTMGSTWRTSLGTIRVTTSPVTCSPFQRRKFSAHVSRQRLLHAGHVEAFGEREGVEGERGSRLPRRWRKAPTTLAALYGPHRRSPHRDRLAFLQLEGPQRPNLKSED